jgi:uracil-DNA glycosylase
MNDYLEDSWNTILSSEFTKPYWHQLWDKITAAATQSTVYPPLPQVFRALNDCPFPTIRVVILGQDPYHGPGQADGRAFSVPDSTAIPPSLRNIYQEIAADTGVTPPASGDLTRLATQGVLLLNTTLTVQAGTAGSHHGWGWEQFTDAVITTISDTHEHVVFLLWGAYAQSKRHLIDETKHLVLAAPHPSPLSAYRGFFGCKHFSQTNAYLALHGQPPIIW